MRIRGSLCILTVLCCYPALAADAASDSLCGASVVVQAADTISRIADRCGVSEAALLNANPYMQSSSDLQVGQTVRIEQGGDTEQKVGAALNALSRKASNAMGALAGEVGSSAQDLLNSNPDLKSRLDTLGRKVGLSGGAPPATLVVKPYSGAPGSIVTIAASGLPNNAPMAIGVGTLNAAFAIIAHAQSSATGAIDAQVKIPEGSTLGSTLVFNVSTGEGVAARSSPFKVAK